MAVSVVTAVRFETPSAPWPAATAAASRRVTVTVEVVRRDAGCRGRPVAGVRLQRVAQVGATERVEVLAVDADDLVTGHQAGLGRRGVRLDAPIATPMVRSPPSAMPVKMANARRTFMTTPATRMTIFFHHGWTENERGSSAASPSSPSSLTKPPMAASSACRASRPCCAGPWRAAGTDPELEHAHVGQARQEVPIVDDHEDAEDGDEQDDRDDRLDETGHALTPMGPRAKAERTSASSATSSSTPGAAGPFPPKRSTAASSSRGMVGSRWCHRGTGRPRRHRRRSGRRGARAGQTGLAGDAQRQNRASSGARKSRRAMATRSGAAAGEGRRSG